MKNTVKAQDRDDDRIPEVRVGALEVRLADSEAEIDAALALRYRVFYEEMSAKPTPEMAARRRDFDAYDKVCDHLLVLDHDRSGADAVVATYRLIRRAAAAQCGGFYSASEFDVSRVEGHQGEILELGRSCVDSSVRNRVTLQLLWRGLASYVMHNGIDIMFGCASLPGTDPQALSLPLAYLYHNHLAPDSLRPKAVAERYVDMNTVPAAEIERRAALAELPPLLKGYLRVGGCVGDGAVIDHQFNTVDVCIVIRTDQVTDKYYKRYITDPGLERRADTT